MATSALAAPSRQEAQLRYRIFSAMVLLLIVFLGVRLVQMQLLDRSEYATEAEGNAIDEDIVRPARGYVYDRHGTLMVDNETVLNVTVTPRFFDETKLGTIAALTGQDTARVERLYRGLRDRSPYQEQVLLKDVDFQVFARMKENQYRLPGVGFEESQRRRYHSEAQAAHVLGYVREISEGQLDLNEEQGYRLGDAFGQTGLERSYEEVLRGRVGRRYSLVNVHGMQVQPYEGGSEDIAPESGFALRLTLDARVQALAESLFVNKRGGAVMLDVKTGGVISMVSAPDYDPSTLSGRLSQADVEYLYQNPAKPLFNRALQTSLPPGSTWKPFMSLVALQEGMIDEDTELHCPGGYMLGRFFRCHGGRHGNISVRTAIQKSCNTFFFRLMNDPLPPAQPVKRMDLTTWSTWANRFGFGRLAPLDLPPGDQNPALIPDSTTLDRMFPLGWGPGTTVNLGIGQGPMGVSPFQLARYTAAVANSGTMVTPHLVLSQLDPATGEETVPARRRPTQIPIDEENFHIVREGMRLVATNGTAVLSQILANERYPEVPIAGKTGTAQNPRGKDHAIFVAFAPYDDPQVAVGVIVENAGFGSSSAAPIASLMIEQYLRGTVDIEDPKRRFLFDRIKLNNSVVNEGASA